MSVYTKTCDVANIQDGQFRDLSHLYLSDQQFALAEELNLKIKECEITLTLMKRNIENFNKSDLNYLIKKIDKISKDIKRLSPSSDSSFFSISEHELYDIRNRICDLKHRVDLLSSESETSYSKPELSVRVTETFDYFTSTIADFFKPEESSKQTTSLYFFFWH